MTLQRRPRADRKLARLSKDQRQRLLGWLDEENRTYAAVVALIRTEFGLSVGMTTVGDFWRRQMRPRREQAAGAGDAPPPAKPPLLSGYSRSVP
ncbi:MAG TPA: hypothetical protein VGE76_02405 [Opitutaceae bacterium]